MCSKHKKISLGFSETPFDPGLHICIIYRDEIERRNIISKYLESGILADEKIGYFTDIMTPDELKKWIAELGIAIPEEKFKNQMVITKAQDMYCPHGKFVVQEMLQRLTQYYDDAMKEGFSGARVTGETTWSLQNIPGIDHFIEYEALINDALEKHPVTVMCQYDVTKFDGAALFDILQVHPYMIVHGLIVKNPTYLKPSEFLKRYYARG